MYLLFDIGGTNSRIAVTQNGVDLLGVKKFATPQNFDEAIEAIAQVASELAQGETFAAAAGGVPAPIHSNGETLFRPPHLPDWDGKPFVSKLSEKLECKVYIANDTALIGLGEAREGAGKDHEIVAFIGSGTGIGGARIVDGRIDANRWGFEPGHHIVNADADPDYWEGYSSGSAMKQEDRSWEDFEKYMAIGLYNTCLFWSPDVVVLGGGLGVSGKLDVPKINQKLQDLNNKRQRFEQMPQVVPAQLGDEGGLRGAFAYLKSRQP